MLNVKVMEIINSKIEKFDTLPEDNCCSPAAFCVYIMLYRDIPRLITITTLFFIADLLPIRNRLLSNLARTFALLVQ